MKLLSQRSLNNLEFFSYQSSSILAIFFHLAEVLAHNIHRRLQILMLSNQLLEVLATCRLMLIDETLVLQLNITNLSIYILFKS